MCFSAPASFIASGGLVLLGAGTFAVAKKKDKILVAIPILFGIQQAFEGVQWLYLNRGESSLVAGYGFLFFALIVWPIYVPAFVYLLDKPRRPLLKGFVALGVAVSGWFLVLLAMNPLRVSILASSVNYDFDAPSQWLLAPPYLAAILGALLVSSRPIFRWFGAAIAALSLVSWWLDEQNFISVWCFFAAIVSLMFFLYVQYRRAKRLRILPL